MAVKDIVLVVDVPHGRAIMVRVLKTFSKYKAKAGTYPSKYKAKTGSLKNTRLKNRRSVFKMFVDNKTFQDFFQLVFLFRFPILSLAFLPYL